MGLTHRPGLRAQDRRGRRRPRPAPANRRLAGAAARRGTHLPARRAQRHRPAPAPVRGRSAVTTTSVEAAEPELVEVTPGQMALIRWAAIEVYAQRLLE